jgi:hypothetical protein
MFKARLGDEMHHIHRWPMRDGGNVVAITAPRKRDARD